MKLNAIMFLVGILVISCNKEPGKGGTSTIRGKIKVEDYNQTFTTLWAEYDGADREVYIIYGDNPTFGDKVETGPDGVFEFNYLTKGSYRIYTYSKDSSLQSPSGEIAIYQEVEITDKKQVVEIPEITVFE